MSSIFSIKTPSKNVKDLLDQWGARAVDADPMLIALFYLVLLSLSEIVTTLVAVRTGVVLYLLSLFVLMLHIAVSWEREQHHCLVGLILVPFIRIISVSMPLVSFPLVYWYLITSIPLLATAVSVMRLLGFSWRDAGLLPTSLNWRIGLGQLVVSLSGLGLGYVEYQILRPEPLIEALTLEALWLPALILLVSTGFLEELIFRRIMQRTAVAWLGRGWGVLYVALLFAVLHIGYKSALDVLFVLLVGLFFGWIVALTGSLLGVTLAHGLTNIMLFLVMPFWLAGGVKQASPSETVAPPPIPTVALVGVAEATPEQSDDEQRSTTNHAPVAPPATSMPPFIRPQPMWTPTPTETPKLSPMEIKIETVTPGERREAGGGRREMGSERPVDRYQTEQIIRYVVQPNDYLIRLARRFDTTLDAILRLNEIRNPNVIQPGQFLLIPARTETPTPGDKLIR